jgi:L,D-transpeptidase YcbB
MRLIGWACVPANQLKRSRRRVEIATLLVAASLLLSGVAFAQPRGVAARVDAIVTSGRLGELRWPNFSGYRSQLRNFYRLSDYSPAWVRAGEPTAQAVALVQILQEADGEGLRAEDYDATRWADRLTLLRGQHEEAEEARFDVALTVCIMRYLSDLHEGRINPQPLGFEFEVSGKKLDLVSFIRECLVEGSGLHEEVAMLEPAFPGYQRLRDALPHYEALAKRDDGEKLPDPKRLVPGGQYAGIPRLTRLLRLLGDMPESVTIPPDSRIYEGALVDAVKHFQGRHGIRPTGVIDSDTVAEMNVPLSGRVAQIRLGLERYRWLPYDVSQPAIIINVPEFRLYAFNPHSQLAFTMNVSVGDDYDFQTPIFEKNLLYLVFRPYWYPPRTILRSEILPDLRKDSSLEENDLELVSASGEVRSSGNVSPEMLEQLQSGKLTARQPPGPDNALGLIKFILPNEHHIYIHDTPVSVHMFSDTERIFSHGCIHAQEPAKLAAWLLRDKPGWSLEQVEHAMHKGRNNVRVNLASPVPVLIVYDTAVVQENGDIHFLEDIYQHDGKLEVELAEGYPYAKGTARAGSRQ